MNPITLARYPQHNDPAWLSEAFDEVGTKERIGAEHNPRVLEYHACTGLGATDDETPWCSSFMCWVMDQCDLTSTRSAASLSWLRWGRELKEPVRGCVVIFERMGSDGQPIPNRGHVALWLAQKDNVTYCLGGNQKNQVGVNAYLTDRVIGYRWPSMPHNSSTNMASTVVGTGATVSAIPTMLDVAASVGSPQSDITSAATTAKTVATQIGIPLTNMVAMGGLFIVVLGVSYIIRERNKKIKKFGI